MHYPNTRGAPEAKSIDFSRHAGNTFSGGGLGESHQAAVVVYEIRFLKLLGNGGGYCTSFLCPLSAHDMGYVVV